MISKTVREEYKNDQKQRTSEAKKLTEQIKKINDEILRLAEEKNKLQAEMGLLIDNGMSQYDALDRIGSMIAEKLGNLPFHRYGPFGICGEYSICWGNNTPGSKQYLLSFRTYSEPEGWITYGTGKELYHAEIGSIADLNGMNKEFKPLPEDDEEFMKIILATEYIKEEK